MLERTK